MKILPILAIIAISGCTGCVGNGLFDTNKPTKPDQTVEQSADDGTDVVKSDGPVRYLVVGMEISRRFGSCPGCELDAKRMTALLKNAFGYEGDTLISGQATKAAVVAKLRAGIEETPANGMFIFVYSGHGGQEYLGGQEPDGAEKQDEFLCLYDTYLQDDEIWSIISKRKGRVMLYFDACHSATMYRSVASDSIAAFEGEARALEAGGLVWSSGFTFDHTKFIEAEALEADGAAPRGQGGMLCWSGCEELEYSYGSSYGGSMTTALTKRWKKGMSYKTLWPLVVKDVQREQPTQHPVQTILGTGFGDDVEAFR